MRLELLPYWIGQAVASRRLQAWHVRRMRARTSPALSVAASPSPRRVFVDLAVISAHDAGTGIQRVVRELALALLTEAPAEWDIRFVSARRKRPYFCISWPDQTVPATMEPMRARSGDVFIGLDYSLDAVRRHRSQLARFRREGGVLWFLVHDLLPLNRPDWFSLNTVIRYKSWFEILAGLADGFLCNSPQTEAELKNALAQYYGLTVGYSTQVLPMGYALPSGPSADWDAAKAPARFDLTEPFALMVGTLEPRKGHADILAAFGRAWAAGSTDRLVLVGRTGWQVDALRESILAHPEYGSKLLWFDDVEDSELVRIYAACSGVVIGSYAEGFGLPLIEALGHGKPVLARDLPVFRVHEGKGVHFFPTEAQPQELADFLVPWLHAARQGSIAVVRPTQDWRQSAALLVAAIAGGRLAVRSAQTVTS